MNDSGFAERIVAWQRRHGRHDLPWQATRDPYRIWLSEIMLQQTQVGTVIPYYQRLLSRFPDVAALAAAAEDEVLALWSGLGYYSRARNLQRAARQVMATHAGAFPREAAAIAELPGIGRSTAAAIAAFAFGVRGAILDGNVKRVLARVFAIEGVPGAARVERELWALAESLLPASGIEPYTQGLMDLGATVCTRSKPRCGECPLAESCAAHATGRTAELPARRPAKIAPVRRTAMLIARHAGEVLLEKRPATGVWGGMWCFPEVPEATDPIGWCAVHLGVAAEPGPPLAPFAHVFTHFKLEIVPRVVELPHAPSLAAEPGRLWLTPEDALTAAIPVPVRKLLAGLIPPPIFG